jgi:hypothetical protein
MYGTKKHSRFSSGSSMLCISQLSSTSASYQSTELTLGNRVLLEKLIVAQVVKNMSPSILPEESLPYSQETAIGSCHEPVKSRPQPHIYNFINTFNIIFTSTLRSPSVFFLSGFQLHFYCICHLTFPCYLPDLSNPLSFRRPNKACCSTGGPCHRHPLLIGPGKSPLESPLVIVVFNSFYKNISADNTVSLTAN